MVMVMMMVMMMMVTRSRFTILTAARSGETRLAKSTRRSRIENSEVKSETECCTRQYEYCCGLLVVSWWMREGHQWSRQMIQFMAAKAARDSVVALLTRGFSLTDDAWIVPEGYVCDAEDARLLEELHTKHGFPDIAIDGPEPVPPRCRVH
jgi:hypothetical protein